MAASSAIHSYNSTLSYSATQGGSYTEVAECCDISDDVVEVEAAKVSHLKSDNAAHEYIAGMIEPGTATIELNFLKAQLTHVMAIIRTSYWWKITDSDGSVTNFKAFYNKVTKKTSMSDRITLAITLKKTGLPAFTAAA